MESRVQNLGLGALMLVMQIMGSVGPFDKTLRPGNILIDPQIFCCADLCPSPLFPELLSGTYEKPSTGSLLW